VLKVPGRHAPWRQTDALTACGGQKVDQPPILPSSNPSIVVMKPAKDRISHDPRWRLHVCTQHVFWWIRNTLTNPLMRSRTIEIRDILADDTMEMSLTQNEDMIQAFASYTANEALADRIGLWCCNRCFELWGSKTPSEVNFSVKCPSISRGKALEPVCRPIQTIGSFRST